VAIRAILLCAGAGTRFGSNKLLAPLRRPDGDEEPLVCRTARTFSSHLATLAVIRPGEKALASALEASGCEVVETDRAVHGMGESLAAGIAATPTAAGWVVGLGDMPFVEPATLSRVIDALAKGALIAAPFNADTGRRGHPVAFSGRLREELAALSGDQGARSVIARHRHAVVLIPAEDRGIFLDIDTPRDLAGG
jgi:molybdenum cofactor cytidylyltransferase